MTVIDNFYKQGRFEAFHSFIYRVCIPTNIASAIAIFIYVFCFITIKFEYLDLAFFILCFVTIIAQFVFAPLTNYLCTKEISSKIFNWKTGQSNTETRTELLKIILNFPLTKGIETFLHFVCCTLVIAIFYYFQIPLDTKTTIMH